MKRLARRLVRGDGTVVVLAVLCVAGAMLMGANGPDAALVAAESKPVRLFDDDGGSAMFPRAPLGSAWRRSRCVVVSVDGDTPAELRLRGRSSGSGLDRFLSMQIESGRGGSFGSCSGFQGRSVYRGTLQAFTRAHGDASRGLPLDPAADAVTYRFTFAVTDPEASGLHASAAFVWMASLPSGRAVTRPVSVAVDTVAPPDVRPGVDEQQRPTTAPTSRPAAATDVVIDQGSPTGAGAGAEEPVTPWHRVRDVARIVGRVAAVAASKASFPFLLLLVVAAFIALQDRIDRRDPKLATAPVHADPVLVFVPPPSKRPL